MLTAALVVLLCAYFLSVLQLDLRGHVSTAQRSARTIRVDSLLTTVAHSDSRVCLCCPAQPALLDHVSACFFLIRMQSVLRCVVCVGAHICFCVVVVCFPAGPPGAPGAPGMSPAAKSLPKKKIVASKVPLKPLHWTRIDDAAIDKTCFAEIMKEDAKAGETKMDLAAIEALFATKPPAAAAAAAKKDDAAAPAAGAGVAGRAPSVGAAAAPAPKKEVVSLIDPKRSYAIDIGTSRLKIPHATLKLAMLAMDESVLTVDRLSGLLPSMPTVEEIELVRNWVAGGDSGVRGDPSILGATERFFWTLSSIEGCPDLSGRLGAMLFKSSFSETSAGLESQFLSVNRMLTSLRGSSKLRKLFSLILQLGNFLNGANAKLTGYYGFRLATLNQLKLTKSADGSMSLLDFLITQARERFGPSFSCQLMEEDLEGIGAVAQIESTVVAAELGKLRTSLAKLDSGLKVMRKKKAAAVAAKMQQKRRGTVAASAAPVIKPMAPIASISEDGDDPPPPPPPEPEPEVAPVDETPDRFVAVMSAFLSEAQSRFNALETLSAAVVTETENVWEYFGEKRTSGGWETLLGRFADLAVRARAHNTGLSNALRARLQGRSTRFCSLLLFCLFCALSVLVVASKLGCKANRAWSVQRPLSSRRRRRRA